MKNQIISNYKGTFEDIYKYNNCRKLLEHSGIIFLYTSIASNTKTETIRYYQNAV